MAIFEKSNPPASGPSVATDAAEQNVQIVQATHTDKDRVADTVEKDEEVNGESKDVQSAKEPTAGLGNYFVSAPKFEI